LSGDSGGGIYKNGNVVGDQYNTTTGNILYDNGAGLDCDFINSEMNANIEEKRSDCAD
jgi:hypothetical protein